MSTTYTSRDVYEYISQQANDPILERRRCAVSGAEFPIYTSDAAFYEKISPVFNGTKYAIPFPTLCPEERQRRRLLFRNERKLYKRTCDATGESIISIYSPEKPYKVYNQKFRWGDGWSALDYGREFDFTRTFTEQFGELMRDVPRYALANEYTSCENSEYNNLSAELKDCYFCFGVGTSEKALYTEISRELHEVSDVFVSMGCERVYECVECIKVTDSHHCFGCIQGSYLYGCTDMVGCSFCINSSHLRNATYYINNMPCTPEEFAAYSHKHIGYRKADYKPSLFLSQCEKCYGNALHNSKNSAFCFDSVVEDSKYTLAAGKSSATYDSTHCGYGSEFFCEVLGSTGYGLSFVSNTRTSKFCLYCDLVANCTYCFGCIGLHNKQYCIFNVQYTKEEYDQLLPRIIAHMQTTGEWGEFFHHTLSPFGYNETPISMLEPLLRDDAIRLGYAWQETSYDPVIPEGVTVIERKNFTDDAWENLIDNPDITKSIVVCETSGRPFRFVAQEIQFYKKYAISLPSKHPDMRAQERVALRPGKILYLRACDATGEQVLSVYPAHYSGKIYSQAAYEKALEM